MIKYNDHISFKEEELSKLLRDYATTAADSKNVRELVKIAKIRLELVTTNVTSGSYKDLANDEDFSHVNYALAALEDAIRIRNKVK